MTDRTDVEFPAGPRGELCRAWLYRPAAPATMPLIIMAHGLGAVKEMRLDAFAEQFAAAGYACLVFDYRHFGASQGEPRQLLSIPAQLEDWKAAIAYGRTVPGIRQDAICLWGTSFSGGHVVATAAADPSIACVIAQCPFTDGIASALAVHPLSAVKLGVLAIADFIAAACGQKPVRVALTGSSGQAALMVAPDAPAGYRGLIPPGFAGFETTVAARFGLQIIFYRPGRQAGNVTCPILFCVCETDSVAPSGPTKRFAARARHGQINLYQAGHFDIYTGDAFTRVVSDELAFLRRHLLREGMPREESIDEGSH